MKRCNIEELHDDTNELEHLAKSDGRQHSTSTHYIPVTRIKTQSVMLEDHRARLQNVRLALDDPKDPSPKQTESDLPYDTAFSASLAQVLGLPQIQQINALFM
jgi:hypothetical protein